ncbi:MAG TPA: type IV conjugative transfer system protein TraL [Aquifex aeolicus]|nr:type IV conjugative transfer system protein TraL [Aquifex aeolicus]
MRKRIPRYLNAQIQMGWWEFDEFVLLFIPAFIGLMNDLAEIGIVVGAGLYAIYKRFKENSQEGFIWHFLYWYGLWRREFILPSWIRELVE